MDNSDTILPFPEMKGGRGMIGIPKLTTWVSAFVFLVLVIVIVRNFVRSSTGRATLSVREDETAAKAMGINVAGSKLLAFVLGSFVAGIGGGVYAHYIGFLSPDTFSFLAGFNPLIIVVFGGLGSMTGTIAASFVWIFFLEGFLRVLLGQMGTEAPTWRFVLYPITLLLLMLIRPQGLLGSVEWGFLKPDKAMRARAQRLPRHPRGRAQQKERPDMADTMATGARPRDRRAHQVFRRPVRGEELLPRSPGGRPLGPDRSERRRQDHRVQPHHRAHPALLGRDRRSKDERIDGLEPYEITRLGIARTFQNIRLFSNLSVLDNVRIAYHPHAGYGLSDSLLRTRKFAAKEKELTEQALDFLSIFKLEGIAEEIRKNLPYGEQRRVEIARALACNPRVLLLDEPAAGMNPREIIELMELIHFIRDRFKLTILLIEHQMRVVMGICETDHRHGLRRGDRPGHAEGDPGQPDRHRGVPRQRSREQCCRLRTSTSTTAQSTRSRASPST